MSLGGNVKLEVDTERGFPTRTDVRGLRGGEKGVGGHY